MEAEAAEAPKAVASAGRRQVEPPAAGPRNSGKHQALSSSASVPSSATEARRKQTSSRGAPLSRSRVLPGPRSASPPMGSRASLSSSKLASVCASQRRARSASPSESQSRGQKSGALREAASREVSPETSAGPPLTAACPGPGKQRLRGQPRQSSPSQAAPQPTQGRREQPNPKARPSPLGSDRKRPDMTKADAEQLFRNWDVFNAEVMSQFTALWKTLGQLQEEALRERREKEELRHENRQLQMRLDRLSQDVGPTSAGPLSRPQTSGASSVPVEDIPPSWTSNCSGASSVPVEAVQPIVAPSPPKSLMTSFRQVAPVRSPVQVPQSRQSLPAQLEGTSPQPLTPLVEHPFARVSTTLARSAYLPSGVRPVQVAAPVPNLPEMRVGAGTIHVGPPMARHTLYPTTTTTTWHLH